MSRFIGVDLGWYGKPSGLASMGLKGGRLHLRNVTRLEDTGQPRLYLTDSTYSRRILGMREYSGGQAG